MELNCIDGRLIVATPRDLGIIQTGNRFMFKVENETNRKVILRHDDFDPTENIPTDTPNRVRVNANGDLAINLDEVEPTRRVIVMAMESTSHDVIVDSNC